MSENIFLATFAAKLAECLNLYDSDRPRDAVLLLQSLEEGISKLGLESLDAELVPSYSSALDALKNDKNLRRIRKTKNEIVSLLDDMKSDEGWKFIWEDNASKTLQKIDTNSGIASFKVSGVIQTNIFHAISCLNETDLFSEWIPGCKVAERVDTLSKFRMNIFSVFPMLWPMADRFSMINGYGDVLEDGSVVIYMRSIDDDPEAPGRRLPEHQDFAKLLASGAVPVSLYGGFRFVSVTPEITEVIIILNIDPKVAIPKALLNYVVTNFCYLIVPFMKKQSEKFRPGGVHQNRIEQNPVIYDEIRRRLAPSSSMSPIAHEENDSKAGPLIHNCGDKFLRCRPDGAKQIDSLSDFTLTTCKSTFGNQVEASVVSGASQMLKKRGIDDVRGETDTASMESRRVMECMTIVKTFKWMVSFLFFFWLLMGSLRSNIYLGIVGHYFLCLFGSAVLVNLEVSMRFLDVSRIYVQLALMHGSDSRGDASRFSSRFVNNFELRSGQIYAGVPIAAGSIALVVALMALTIVFIVLFAVDTTKFQFFAALCRTIESRTGAAVFIVVFTTLGVYCSLERLRHSLVRFYGASTPTYSVGSEAFRSLALSALVDEAAPPDSGLGETMSSFNEARRAYISAFVHGNYLKLASLMLLLFVQLLRVAIAAACTFICSAISSNAVGPAVEHKFALKLPIQARERAAPSSEPVVEQLREKSGVSATGSDSSRDREGDSRRANCDFQGYASIRQKFLFKRRYVVVRNGELAYFKSAEDAISGQSPMRDPWKLSRFVLSPPSAQVKNMSVSPSHRSSSPILATYSGNALVKDRSISSLSLWHNCSVFKSICNPSPDIAEIRVGLVPIAAINSSNFFEGDKIDDSVSSSRYNIDM